jgi:hypothetical protein
MRRNKMRVLAFAGCVLALTMVGCGSPKEEGGAVQGKVVASYDEALASAKSENRPILVVAYQAGLEEKIDQNLLNDPAVKERSSKVITAKLDTSSQGQAISQLGITNYPAVLILRPDGTEAWRSQGVPMPGAVASEIDKVAASKN